MKRVFYILTIALAILLGSCSNDVEMSYGTIFGVVSDSETGEPVRNASVILSPGNLTTTTGNDGNYQFDKINEGTYKLQVSSYGYKTISRQISVMGNSQSMCDILLVPAQELSGIILSTTKLNFDTTYSELVFNITNVGSSGTVAWSVGDISVGWLTVMPISGEVGMGQSVSVKVLVDRSKLTASESTFITIYAASGSQSIEVLVAKDNLSGGNTNNGGDTNNNGGTTTPTSGDVTNGLYGHYRFDGNTKNRDGCDAPNAIAVNSPEYVEGMYGSQAIKFTSKFGEYLNFPDPMIDDYDFTVSFWVKGLSDGHIFHVENGGHYEYKTKLICRMIGNSLDLLGGGYYFYLPSYRDLPYTPYFSHSEIDSSQWTMITITCEAQSYDSYMTLYIDGEMVDMVNRNTVDKGDGIKFVFGGALEDVSGANMTVENLRIYTRPLSAKEVLRIYDYEK